MLHRLQLHLCVCDTCVCVTRVGSRMYVCLQISSFICIIMDAYEMDVSILVCDGGREEEGEVVSWYKEDAVKTVIARYARCGAWVVFSGLGDLGHGPLHSKLTQRPMDLVGILLHKPASVGLLSALAVEPVCLRLTPCYGILPQDFLG